ncbi:MAG TPA: symporter [Bacteroidales bacterium]|jgi:BASS family bile acid:Na+ symporter|nr:symporter [Bacteroidales bacterium]
MFETLKTIDTVRLNLSTGAGLVINIALALIMFGVALGIKVRDFKNILQAPKVPIIGFVSQFFVLPVLTFLVVILIKDYITPTVGLGMILVAACPGGNISNFMSALAKGNAALSITLTAIATMSALFLTPFNFTFWGGLYISQLNVDAPELLQRLVIDPKKVFQTVFILLGIPLMLGMFVNHYFPKFTSKIMKPIKVFSIVVFIGIVVGLLQKNMQYFMMYIQYIFFIVLFHNILAFLSGYLFASANKIKGANQRAITIETGIQNSGLAIVLLINPKIFPPELAIGGMVFIAAWWGVWHIISGLSLAGVWSFFPPKK